MAEIAGRLAGQLVLDDEQPAALVYDLDRVAARARALQDALPEFHHCLALKSAPYAGLLRRFGAWGFGFEAASRTEGLVARQACPQATILFDSPAKTRREIAQAQADGWLLSANSFDELARVHAPCSLRVNTLAGAGTIAQTSVAQVGSRFGEAWDTLPADLHCAGWHAHVGSQGISLEQLVLSAQRLVHLAQRRPGTQWLNLGGGLPVGADFGAYAQALRAGVPALFEGRWRVYTEMGRSLLADTASAFSRVEYVQRDTVTQHLGADFLLRRVYRPQDWHYPMRALGSDFATVPSTRGATRRHTVAGPLCFAGDLLGALDSPPLCEGDLIEITQVGAYATSMWSRHCSRPMPPVYGLEGNALVLISSGESERDILDLWREPD